MAREFVTGVDSIAKDLRRLTDAVCGERRIEYVEPRRTPIGTAHTNAPGTIRVLPSLPPGDDRAAD